MKKIIIAIKNEMLKLFSKKSTYILLIVAALLAAAPIVLNKIVNEMSPNSNSFVNDYQYEYEKNDITQVLNKNNQNTNEEEKEIIEKLGNFKLQQLEKRKNNDDLNNSWQMEINSMLKDKETNIFVIKLLNEGYNYFHIADVAKQIYINIDDNITKDYNDKKLLADYQNELEQEYNDYTNILENNNYYAYIEHKNDSIKKDIEASNKVLATVKEQLDKENKKEIKDQESILELNKQIDAIENTIKTNNNMSDVNKYIIDNKIEYNVKEWRHKTLENIKSQNMNLEYSMNDKKSEKEYYFTSNNFNGIDNKNVPYEQYLKAYEEEIKIKQGEIDKSWYALNNNIPINQNNAKTATASLYDNLLVVIAIIIAGEIVAKEFSTGTIRLTLTRPIKRWKLLLSKLVTCYIMVIILAVITYLAALLTGGLLFGFDSYFIPELVNSAGTIIEQSYLLIALQNLTICLLPVVFFVTGAFMLSTLTKSSALAVGISIGGLFASSIANMMLIFNPMKWIQYTPLPYANFASFFGNMKDVIIGNNIKYGMNITIENGCLMLLACIVIAIVISFITFIRTDIKNQ